MLAPGARSASRSFEAGIRIDPREFLTAFNTGGSGQEAAAADTLNRVECLSQRDAYSDDPWSEVDDRTGRPPGAVGATKWDRSPMTASGSVSLRDGVRFDLSTGEVVVADADDPGGDTAVLSHAHGDHLYSRAPGGVVCSDLTARLVAARRSEAGAIDRTTRPNVAQVPAGHVPGSRATVIEDEDTTYLYTGDLSTRERFGLPGFDPAAVASEWDVDALVIETTYGKPEYVFDDQRTLERRIVDWLDETAARPVLLFGYALGRAQELESLVRRSGRDRLLVTEAVERVDDVLARARGPDSDSAAERYRSGTTLGAGDALVLPAQTTSLPFVDRIAERADAIKAGFSGWAVDEAFAYRGGYDETFVLSDHCDFSELVAVVETLVPDRVYTQHGFADAFATHVETELGIPARSLKPNQTTLGDF